MSDDTQMKTGKQMNMQVSREKIRELRTAYQELDFKKLSNKDQQLRLETIKRSFSGPNVNDRDVTKAIEIAAVIAKHSSEEEWEQFVVTGQAPGIVPLSPAQLEMASGGGILDFFFKAAVKVTTPGGMDWDAKSNAEYWNS